MEWLNDELIAKQVKEEDGIVTDSVAAVDCKEYKLTMGMKRDMIPDMDLVKCRRVRFPHHV